MGGGKECDDDEMAMDGSNGIKIPGLSIVAGNVTNGGDEAADANVDVERDGNEKEKKIEDENEDENEDELVEQAGVVETDDIAGAGATAAAATATTTVVAEVGDVATDTDVDMEHGQAQKIPSKSEAIEESGDNATMNEPNEGATTGAIPVMAATSRSRVELPRQELTTTTATKATEDGVDEDEHRIQIKDGEAIHQAYLKEDLVVNRETIMAKGIQEDIDDTEAQDRPSRKDVDTTNLSATQHATIADPSKLDDTVDAQEREWATDSSPIDSSSDTDSSSDVSTTTDDSAENDNDDDSDDDAEADADEDGGYRMLDPEEQARILMLADGGSDDEGNARGKNKGEGGQLRTTNERPEEVVPKPNIVVAEDMKIEALGNVEAVVENTVLIKAKTSGEYRVLESNSLICHQDRAVVGVVAETLGRVEQPMYTVRFTNQEAIQEAGVADKGTPLYYVEKHSTFVFTQPLRAVKGSDASNFHDEEVDAEEMEFSDDEAEAEHKRQLKLRKQGRKDEASERTGLPAKRGRGGRVMPRHHQQQGQPRGGEAEVVMNYDDIPPPSEDGYNTLVRPENFQQMMAGGEPPLEGRSHDQSQVPTPSHRGSDRGRGRGSHHGRGGRSRGGQVRSNHLGNSGPRPNQWHRPSNVPASPSLPQPPPNGYPLPQPPPLQHPPPNQPINTSALTSPAAASTPFSYQKPTPPNAPAISPQPSPHPAWNPSPISPLPPAPFASGLSSQLPPSSSLQQPYQSPNQYQASNNSHHFPHSYHAPAEPQPQFQPLANQQHSKPPYHQSQMSPQPFPPSSSFHPHPNSTIPPSYSTFSPPSSARFSYNAPQRQQQYAPHGRPPSSNHNLPNNAINNSDKNGTFQPHKSSLATSASLSVSVPGSTISTPHQQQHPPSVPQTPVSGMPVGAMPSMPPPGSHINPAFWSGMGKK